MAPLPAPIRAGLGLLATAIDTVQELVEHAPEIPMEAVGNSMQLSMRLQQHYVALMTRGDEFIASLRGAPDEPPAWATFDDLPPTAAASDDPVDDGFAGVDLADDNLISDEAVEAEPGGGESRRAVFDDDSSRAVFDDDSGRAVFDDDSSRAVFDDDVLDVPPAELQDEPRQAGQGDPLLDAVSAALEASVAAGPGLAKAPATKVAGTKVAAKIAEKKIDAKKIPPTKIGAKTVAAKKAPAKKAPASARAHADATGEPPAVKKVPAKKTISSKALKRAAEAASHDPIAASATPLNHTVSAASKVAAKTTGRRVPAKKSAAVRAMDATGARTSAVGDLNADQPSSADSFTVAPRLDAGLDNGDASARPRSAFDLAETPVEDVVVLESAGAESGAAPAAASDGSLPGSTPGA